jgi:hypothetical protein
MPTPRDYDTAPERYRLGMRVTAAHLAPGVNLQARIVEHLLAAGVTPCSTPAAARVRSWRLPRRCA